MNIEENAIYDALGIGENEREAAEPADSEKDEEGVQETESTETEREENEETQENGETQQEEQSPEERHQNAARRREAEKQAAIDEAVERAVAKERQENEQKMSALFHKAGLKNTLSGTSIESIADFEAWQNQWSAQRIERELADGKLSPEGLQEAISSNPVMKQAEELIKQQQEESRAQKEAAMKLKVEGEIKEIQKINPNIKNIEDLLKMDKAKEFYDYVQKGNSFLDAYRLSHFEEITAQKAAAAKQQAMSNARGKDHLVPFQSRGGGNTDVPKDELNIFKAINPNATDSDIQKYYNEYKNKK